MSPPNSRPGPDDAPPLPSVLIPDSSSSSPVKQPDNVQRRSETSSESPPPPTDISDRLLVLTAAFIPITLKLVCQDKTEQVCQALSVLVPIFISVHLGAAFAAFVIPLNGGNPIFLRRLQLIWAVLFALGLCCIVVQISLYALILGNPVTAIMTALVVIFFSLPGFLIVWLKWYPVPPFERRGIEE